MPAISLDGLDLIRETDLAKMLGEHPNSTRKRRKRGGDGLVAIVASPHKIYYRRADVVAWLESRAVGGAR